MEEFRNFQVWTPEGLRDVTGAFRLYKKEMEKYERVAMGNRPSWLVEIDRFWQTQAGGGDPITLWTQIPMLNFEPPSATFAVSGPASKESGPSTWDRIIVGTHSGPIRVFAISWYDRRALQHRGSHVRLRKRSPPSSLTATGFRRFKFPS